MGKARTRDVKSKASRRTVVLDSGALIAFERADERMRALLLEARATGTRLVIPAGVLAQVWRDPAKQVAIGGLTKAAETMVMPLDKVLAEAAGILCGRRQTSDVIDASVVLTARREGHAVIVTSDVADLRHLDKAVGLHRI
jgi:predicted nucleic acid-binding protein